MPLAKRYFGQKCATHFSTHKHKTKSETKTSKDVTSHKTNKPIHIVSTGVKACRVQQLFFEKFGLNLILHDKNNIYAIHVQIAGAIFMVIVIHNGSSDSKC